MRPFTTLRAGGPAEFLMRARTVDQLADAAILVQKERYQTTYLGWGSNVLASDAGVRGLVLVNLAQNISVQPSGEVLADAGCGYQELFLNTAQASLTGLEFAVGIPGTLGGALVSNAGAYRSCIAEHIREIEVVFEGRRQWVEPEFMRFSYRDSILRRPDPPPIALLRVRLQLRKGNPKLIYDAARDYQRQRISKQPGMASAGSFFKNVNDSRLAVSLDALPQHLKDSGVVPSGYLIQEVGMRGFRLDGAMFSHKHANILVNVGGSTAANIRRLASIARDKVEERFGVRMEEEVLYLGDWTSFEA